MKIHYILTYDPSLISSKVDMKKLLRPMTCHNCAYCFETYRLIEMMGHSGQSICTYPFSVEEHEAGNDCLGRAMDLDEYQKAFEYLKFTSGHSKLGPICGSFELNAQTTDEIEQGRLLIAGDSIINLPPVRAILSAFRKHIRAHSENQNKARELVAVALDGFSMPPRKPGVEISKRPHMIEIVKRLSPLVGKISPQYLSDACSFLNQSERRGLTEKLGGLIK